MEQFEGKIININGDRKTFKVQNKESTRTFRSFNPIGKEFSPSDYVKINYYIKEFDNKKYNNVKSMEVIKDDSEINKTETKIDYKISESKESKEKIASMLISYSKDIYIALLENKERVSLASVVSDVLTEYERILKSL